MSFLIYALYHFAPLPDPDARSEPLKALAGAHGVTGSLLLAPEGVNGTIAGPRAGLDAVLAHLRDWPGFSALEHKESWSDAPPFGRLKVRLKREIVAMGAPGLNPQDAGDYVAPEDWNALIADPDVAVIDTRNDYEVGIGTFEGALDPKTATFRDFPAWAQDFRRKTNATRVAMFCTGGIRCEKASAYMKTLGFDAVYHLKGGILKYLEETPSEDSLWRGQCFVFDERVSVGHGLTPGDHALCRACRRPVSPEQRRDAAYEEGVQCPACVDDFSPADRARFRERQRQITLAAQRGERHLAGTSEDEPSST